MSFLRIIVSFAHLVPDLFGCDLAVKRPALFSLSTRTPRLCGMQCQAGSALAIDCVSMNAMHSAYIHPVLAVEVQTARQPGLR